MTRIERILYPFDLSQSIDEALIYSVALAAAFNAKLYLCHCVDSLETLSAQDRERIELAFEEKFRQCPRLGRSKTINWESLILEGYPAEAISNAAAEKHVELIVMRSRRRPLADKLLGSTAEALCRMAPCPVMVTHEGERDWVSPEADNISLKRILIAYDFSDDSEIALQFALSISNGYEAEMHLLHVLPARNYNNGHELRCVSPALDIDFGDSARRLKNALPGSVSHSNKVRLSVSEGQPYREVLEYAEEHNIDLICMGVRGAGYGVNTLFGSNVDRVLRQAPCPVLIARPLRPVCSAIAATVEAVGF